MINGRLSVVEGEDYLIEDGLYVWTAKYLSERGYCCGNDCRNCPYNFVNGRKVISMVPSWTDTLIKSDVDVVGRTKFCIHPSEKVENIPVVGGTKTLKVEKFDKVDADLVVLDKQENPKEFLSDINIPYYASDVRSISGLFDELISLNRVLKNRIINEYIIRLERVLGRKKHNRVLSELPGVIEWLRFPETSIKQILYIIWRKPWMCISRNTFIASMFDQLGYVNMIPEFSTDYPEISLNDYDPQHTLLLFSSEPFPFHKKIDELGELNFPCAIVDGEAYSWFGSRAIEFLEKNTS